MINERLVIENFLAVKKASIDVKKINVIIGPQANGKSLIAKLLHFHRILNSIFLSSIKNDWTKRETDRHIIKEFESRFPRYAWDGSSFFVGYSIGDIFFEIDGKKTGNSKTVVSVNYSPELVKAVNYRKKVYKKAREELSAETSDAGRDRKEINLYYEVVVSPLYLGDYSYFFTRALFIPASRSFFANLQKNIFTFLASNLDIDPYLKEFGSHYENSKRWYKDDYLRRKDPEFVQNLYDAVESIVSGEYEHADQQDWIVKNSRRINLANASSGQQEALPMLLALCYWPLRGSDSSMCFIEEPEAHLFPTSQANIISLLSNICIKQGTGFFITTHSPYIVTALNNLIVAHDKIRDGLLTSAELVDINGPSSAVAYEDVAAYSMCDGVATSIGDDEYRIIGADMLDSISDHFDAVSNFILEK